MPPGAGRLQGLRSHQGSLGSSDSLQFPRTGVQLSVMFSGHCRASWNGIGMGKTDLPRDCQHGLQGHRKPGKCFHGMTVTVTVMERKEAMKTPRTIPALVPDLGSLAGGVAAPCRHRRAQFPRLPGCCTDSQCSTMIRRGHTCPAPQERSGPTATTWREKQVTSGSTF